MCILWFKKPSENMRIKGDLTDLLGITGTAAVLDVDELPQKDRSPVSGS